MIPINTDHFKRCIQTLASSLALFQQAVPDSIEQEVFRNAIIKSYELIQEMAFKLLKKALRDYGYGNKKLDQTPVKELLRLSALHGLMSLDEVERWFGYRDSRNETAHDYGEHLVKDALTLLPRFLEDATQLERGLRKHFAGATGA